MCVRNAWCCRNKKRDDECIHIDGINTALLRDESHKMTVRLFAFDLRVAFCCEACFMLPFAWHGSKKRR